MESRDQSHAPVTCRLFSAAQRGVVSLSCVWAFFFSCPTTKFSAFEFVNFIPHEPEVTLLRSQTSNMEIPAINLKAIVAVHWMLTVWKPTNCGKNMQTIRRQAGIKLSNLDVGARRPRVCLAWIVPSYYLANFSVLVVGVWAVAQRDSVDAVLMFLIGLLLTIVTDIVNLSMFFGLSTLGDTARFSVGMAILSLILKPLSCFFIYQMYRERGGEYNINFGFPTVTRSRDTYQSIDHQNQSDNSAKPFIQGEDHQNHGVRSY